MHTQPTFKKKGQRCKARSCFLSRQPQAWSAVLLCNLTSPKLNLGLVSLCGWYNEHVVNTADTLSKSLMFLNKISPTLFVLSALYPLGSTQSRCLVPPLLLFPSLNLLPLNSKHTRRFRQGLCLPHLPCHITLTKPAKIHRVVAA